MFERSEITVAYNKEEQMYKTLEFKGVKYNAGKLLDYYIDSDLKEFKEGEILNHRNGELFDIKDFPIKFKEALKNDSSNSSGFTGKDFENAKSRRYSKIIRESEIKTYEEKLRNDTITLEDIDAWKALMSKTDKKNFSRIMYNNFISINYSKPKPEGLDRNSYSRFFELLHLMSYDNTIRRRKRAIGKSEIADKLGFSSIRTYDNFISKLKKFGMLVKTEGKRNESFIIINPVYAMKNIQLNTTIYSYFKEDLDEILSPLQIKYLELVNQCDENSHTLKILN